MFKQLVLAAFAILAFVHSATASDVTFTGDITYRERIALPEDAELWVSLVAVPGGNVVASAAAPVGSPAQVPLTFTLKVRSRVIDGGGLFGLLAEIRSDHRTLFRSTQPMPVNTLTPAPTLIVVRFSPDPPPAAPTVASPPEETPYPLLDTAWVVTSIGGSPVLGETRVSFSIAPDRRAGGHGGCNNYFTEASFEGGPLSFGPVAGTRMACAPEVMQQEAALFAALAATADYKQSGTALQLLDAAGVALVGLVRSP